MKIRQATIEEFQNYWSNKFLNTKNYFCNGIVENRIEFWAVENIETGKFIGELYIMWDSVDKDEANGINRAYLCAFRVNHELQGQGIGSKLLDRVLERVADYGFDEVTIGIDNSNYDKLLHMYTSHGFTKKIKRKYVDDHFIDCNGFPAEDKNGYDIFLCNLNERSASV